MIVRENKLDYNIGNIEYFLIRFNDGEVVKKDIKCKECLILVFEGSVRCENKEVLNSSIIHVRNDFVKLTAYQEAYIGIILFPTKERSSLCKVYYRDDMLSGWIVGNFEPNIVRNNEFEIAWKQESLGFVEANLGFDNGREDICLVDGEISISGEKLFHGEHRMIKNGVREYMACLQDSTYIIIRNISAKNRMVQLPSYHNVCKAFKEVYSFQVDNVPINTNDISIVVQGPIYNEFTRLCIESIRKVLPGSEIILSTWEGMDVKGLDYDCLVLSSMPKMPVGMYEDGVTIKPFTHNAQIVSTREGVKMAQRKYILKLRSDMVILGNAFLSYWNAITVREKKYSLFSHRILVPNKVTIKNWGSIRNNMPAPFLVSDWFYFGETEDIKMIFQNHRLMSDEEFRPKLKNEDYKEKYNFFYEARYHSEQFNIIELIKEKYPELVFSDWTDLNKEAISFSQEFLYNNFLVLDFRNYGIWLPKYPLNQMRKENVVFYSYNDYRKRYNV